MGNVDMFCRVKFRLYHIFLFAALIPVIIDISKENITPFINYCLREANWMLCFGKTTLFIWPKKSAIDLMIQSLDLVVRITAKFARHESNGASLGAYKREALPSIS
jgi:hypothetical protein